MTYILRERHTHSDRLERWFSPDSIGRVSAAFKDWYGPPVAIKGAPGRVYVAGGGDFLGPLNAGSAQGMLDFAQQRARAAVRRSTRRSMYTASAGFSSLGDLISEMTVGGKGRQFIYRKSGTAGVVDQSSSLWKVAGQPSAASAASAAPGGDAPTDATTGAFLFTNPAGGDTQHLVRWDYTADQNGCSLLMYDRIFQVAKTMSSLATEAVTGVPTRYQSIVSTDANYAGGNFLFPEVTTTLGSTSHNWTVCTYTDQDGNTGITLPTGTGIAGATANRIDYVPSAAGGASWFMALASGDTGIKALTQMQCSASVTGAVDFVIGHPICVAPMNLPANYWSTLSGINDAFSLVRIFDDAALALIELTRPTISATVYNGIFQTVSG